MVDSGRVDGSLNVGIQVPEEASSSRADCRSPKIDSESDLDGEGGAGEV